ncbi:hypothetical protein [Candidatus Nitrosotenuis aquarius]|uniref:hypothetical protein n=1 Tax=Candidatus Nitrosotenuis aquarius TaxID=1846278 RepID=UPI000C1E85B5|nr:hypothetical protein [Candidatus Nitrosotenuis aquarius]
MAAKTMGLVAMAVLLSGALLMGFSADQPADAKPAKDSPKHKFSKWSKKVCGDELCKEGTHLKTVKRIGKSAPHN